MGFDTGGFAGGGGGGGGGVLDGADIYPSEPAYPQFFQLQASGSVLANSASILKDILNLYPITFPAQMLAKQIGMRYSSGGDR